MRRRALMLAAAPLAALTWMLALLAQPAMAQVGGAFCAPGESPRFANGIAALQGRLGDPMGTPTECEHVDPTSGDTLQRTTTGLAYYRPSLNTSMFTDGATHWALTDETVVLWRSDSVTPPQPTDAEAAYLQRTQTVAGRAAALQRQLTSVRQQAERGQLDSLDVASLQTLTSDFKSARDAFAAVRAPARLGRYHGMMVVSLNTGMGAAELLLQARQIETPSLREGFISSATKHRLESERLQRAATDAYSRALPIVVN